MSSKDIASHIPIFIGQDFQSWKEMMSDYLGAQRLLGYVLGQCQRPVAANVAQPTQAELTAQADWDEINLQVKSMISMRLSSNLRTHIGTTSAAMWTSLEQRYGVPHFTGIYKDYGLAHSIRLTTGENPEIRIQKIWTILECLWANRCVLSNYLQGMLFLKAIPKEWNTVAQLYCNGMQMANITFDGVWDAIMAEFEHIAHPAQLAHHADKISAMKHKGQSPHFKEQRKPNSAPCLATQAPHGESSVKRTRKGGKCEKAHKAQAAHNIVSSAFVPSAVLNRMQESHYLEAGPSTSHVEEVVKQPTPTPVPATIIGGPSQAPVRSAAPVSIASIQPLSITYSKAVTLSMQSVSGLSSTKALCNMEKERMLLKKVGVQPTAESLRAMHKIVEEQDEAVDKVLGKHCKFMEFANNSPPVQNTVALSSTLPEKPVEPSLQDSPPPAPAFKYMKEYDEHEKKCRNRTKKAKKAKKDSVHLAPSEMEMTQNVQVFSEVSPNPISESGKPLFLEENSKMFPNSPSIINPKHPRAKYFKALIESLNLDDDEGYLNDLSLDINHRTDKSSQVEYEEPLDWGIPSAQDDQSSDEDSISNKLAVMAGLSCLSLTLASTRWSSHAPSSRLSKGNQREVRCFGGDNWDNNPDSHAYDDHGYNRLVSTNFTICTLTKQKITAIK
jgi:hypothetical protein